MNCAHTTPASVLHVPKKSEEMVASDPGGKGWVFEGEVDDVAFATLLELDEDDDARCF